MTHPTHYSLLLPREIAELGIASQDRLAHVLGASLIDHIDELDDLTDAHNDLTDAHNDAIKRISDLETHVVPDLETQVERLRATIAILENALAAKI